MNPGTQIPAQCPTSVWICGTGPAPAPAQAADGNTTATGLGKCYTHPVGECMVAGAAAQGPQNTAATICTQYGCPPPAFGAAQPQMSTAFTTCTQPIVCQPHNTLVSQVPYCPTVAPMCPPQPNTLAGGGQAQAQFPTWPIGQCTVGVLTAVAGCSNQQGPGQIPTLPIGQCTIGVTVGVLTAVAGCGIQAQAQGAAYTQVWQCATGTTPVAGNQAQAPGWPITVACPPAQANQNVSVPPNCPTVQPNQCPTVYPPCGANAGGGQAQGAIYTLFGCQPTQHVATCTTIAGYTHNPPQCPQPNAAPAGVAYTQYPFGCTTVTSNPAAAHTQLLGCTTATAPPPATNFPGCTGVTGTPATVAHTHLMGCTTITSAPAQAQAQTIGGWTSNTPCTVAVPTQGQGPWTTNPPCTTLVPAQAQGAGWTAVPACTTIAQGAGGQNGPVGTAFPPTFHPTGGCGPANAPAAGGQAQAQTQIPTIPVTACAVTVIAGCGHVTGIPYVC